MLLRWDPFRELDRVSDDLMRSANRTSPRGVPMDAYRRGEEVHVLFDLPGIDPASVELTVEKNVLTVHAERGWQPQEGDEVLISERPRGSFTRQLFLGDNLDTAKIEANFESGVLHVTVPVAEAAKPRKVEITNAAGSSGPTPIDATSTARTARTAKTVNAGEASSTNGRRELVDA